MEVRALEFVASFLFQHNRSYVKQLTLLVKHHGHQQPYNPDLFTGAYMIMYETAVRNAEIQTEDALENSPEAFKCCLRKAKAPMKVVSSVVHSGHAEVCEGGVSIDTCNNWDSWFDLYKIAAGQANPILAVNQNGGSIVDFMDKESLKKAHQKNVCPRTLGRFYGRNFEV